jgi:hypothetical protein
VLVRGRVELRFEGAPRLLRDVGGTNDGGSLHSGIGLGLEVAQPADADHADL